MKLLFNLIYVLIYRKIRNVYINFQYQTFTASQAPLYSCTILCMECDMSFIKIQGGYVSKQVAWNWLESFMINSPKIPKSLLDMASVIKFMRLDTTFSALYFNNADVFTLFRIPAVELVCLRVSATTKTKMHISGQWLAGNTCFAIESEPSAFTPEYHLT